MSGGKIIDFASYLARSRREAGDLSDEEVKAWADDCKRRALRSFCKYERDAFIGFCVVVYDEANDRACVLLGYPHRVVARYNIDDDGKLRRVKPSEPDDELLRQHVSD